MLNSHPKWMSDCKMFHRCKTRSYCRTNSKNDSLKSQQGSLVLQAGSHTCGGFSFRMRIENWELNVGQILPSAFCQVIFARALSRNLVAICRFGFFAHSMGTTGMVTTPVGSNARVAT